jgi:adenosine kinase
MQFAHLNTVSDAAGRHTAPEGTAAPGGKAAARAAAEHQVALGIVAPGAKAAARGAAEYEVALGIVAPDGRQAMLEHAAQFKAANIPFIFDPGQGLPMFGAEELALFIEQATWVAVNDYEWEMMQQKTGLTAAEVVAQVDALIVTRGADGSVIHTKERTLTIPAVKPHALIDPTGCGDAYRAGLIHGLLQSLDWEATGRLASLMGSIKIESRGPQNHDFTQAEFERRYHENFG